MANINIYGTLVRPVDSDKIVQGSQVEGGYFTCNNLPTTGAWTSGQLCYCTSTSKFYQYNGTSWIEAFEEMTETEVASAFDTAYNEAYPESTPE
jgi:hypothetical protein